MAIIEPFGLILCIFGCIIAKDKSKKMDFYLIEAAARTAGFVEGVFESLPQLVLQSFNNAENQNWTIFTIASVCFSAVGFLYTCFKLLYAIDKVKYFEGRHQKQQVATESNSAKEEYNENGVEICQEEADECYGISCEEEYM